MYTKESIITTLKEVHNNRNATLKRYTQEMKELQARYEETKTGDYSENSSYWNVRELLHRKELDIKIVNEAIEAFTSFITGLPEQHTYAAVGSFITYEVMEGTPDIKAMSSELSFIITPPALADQNLHALSSSSPIAKASLGKKVGDIISYSTRNNYVYKIKNIE